ncbi:MAG: 7,8-didemethyl-8-hydroxy-5-deazariboflavin synthase subunit CofG [Cyanobacteria bacterium J06649_4]
MERIITYSPAYTLVPTYECFNRCSYCNFRRDPGQDEWMSLAAAKKTLQSLQSQNAVPTVIEILILSGEVHPNSPRRAAWFQRIYDLCELSLSMGFLPHTNAGPLSREEMAQLREVNVSMGLMVEQLAPELLETVHAHAPSKHPEMRLQQLELAGELKIPFTTGLLLGLGETEDDWKESLAAIAHSHTKHGHIQEVILQPHQPGTRQAETRPPCYGSYLANAITLARDLLPADITIQIPPNLIRSDEALLTCLALGAGDLGGIGPVDEANPDYPHRSHDVMDGLLEGAGMVLRSRLPIYEKYDDWLPTRLKARVEDWRAELGKTT